MSTEFKKAFEYKLIYVFTIPDSRHNGYLKIGDATLHTEDSIDRLPPNSHALNQAAHERIKSYTNTAAVTYNLIWTELAIKTVKDDDGNTQLKAFRDYDVHRVLTNSGIPKQTIGDTTGKEWFEIDLETAKAAITAVKKSQANLSNSKISAFTPIVFRPEQLDAINQTVKHFKSSDRMLWNAKMRFGKTTCALEVVRQMNFAKTIIITHRPVVNEGWYEDFGKIFHGNEEFIYGSKANGYNVDELLNSGKKFVYFASMQDLRGSSAVGSKFDKNDEIFNTDWDCVIVDEAHEGTTTILGDNVIKAVIKEGSGYPTKLLALSGTPFNILTDYDTESIYTWDYISEQEYKANWPLEHFGDSNPYEELPELRIYTYDLGEIISNRSYITFEDKAFNFHEFFRTWTGDIKSDYENMPDDAKIGDLVHESDVWSFLNLMTKTDDKSSYPYSNDEYRELFRHSLWMVPGVREAKALKQLMLKHPVFGNGFFDIVNVAGDGDEEEKAEEALTKVRKAIKQAGKDKYTITLSCGKLTTGVTVREWTAVFMLAGSFSTSAANYLQTIFRVQSPCNDDGKIKETSYVFDFAPDRTLKMVANAVSVSSKAGKGKAGDQVILGKFLNYCPVIGISGSEMKEYSATKLMQQLKKAYAERAVQTGFDDLSIYNDDLLKLDDMDIKNFDKLKGIIGKTKAQGKTNDIVVNDQGLTNEEYEEIERIKKKKHKEKLTPEEQARLDELNKARKLRNDAISILRGISIRMPLMIYGSEVDYDEEITLEKFVDAVDDASWEEFMPSGVTKDVFRDFMKYYDAEVFVAAGRKIRNIARSADDYSPTDRVKEISKLFSYFKNPDKETVLTPWRVVNMHMSDCLGGWDFWNGDHSDTLDEPRFVNQGDVTSKVILNPNSKILEINSKTGLYPLYVAYSIYRTKIALLDSSVITKTKENELWLETLQDNVYVICKTPMAKTITRRTLLGYKSGASNVHYFDDLVNMMINKPEQLVKKVTKENYWKKGNGYMHFSAIVGNPPYMENIGNSDSNKALSKQLFPYFMMTAVKLNPDYISMITPSRWFTGEAQDGSFIKLREFMRKNNHFVKIINYNDNRDLFPKVTIGSVNYYLYDMSYSGDVEFTEISESGTNTLKRPLFEEGLDEILPMNNMSGYLSKIKAHGDFVPLSSIASGRNPYGVPDVNSQLEALLSPKKDSLHSLRILCAYEKNMYISPDAVKRMETVVGKWKVFTSKMNGGAGTLLDDGTVAIIGRSFVGEPMSICSGALISFGAFDTEEEANNLKKYMDTKFLRFLVGFKKTSQAIYQNVYSLVPIQDFTNNSDINWENDLCSIDKQLYEKYSFSTEQICFIESKIKKISYDETAEQTVQH